MHRINVNDELPVGPVKLFWIKHFFNFFQRCIIDHILFAVMQVYVVKCFFAKAGNIYRYILKNGDKETISLQEELQFVQLYIDLQQTRFGKGLAVNIDVPDEYMYFKIAPVTLQNMIENALKHNIIDRDSPLIIDLYVENDYLCIRNNRQKKAMVETSNKQGLTQLKRLYQFLTHKPIHIVETENSFMIKITFI